MSKVPVIIIGGGVGGLTAAAYLSKNGINSILIEQNSLLGGRCATRSIDGLSYEIGAIYVGGAAFDHLRDTFGLNLTTFPMRCGIKIGKGMASFPLGKRTLIEFIFSGIPFTELLRFRAKAKILSDSDTFEKFKSVGELYDQLISNEKLRRFWDTIVAVSGVSPYGLPSRYFSQESAIAEYKGLNPEYIAGGNGQIAAKLMEVAEKKCKIIMNKTIKKIIIEKERVVGVEADGENLFAETIISNVGLRQTVLNLTRRENWKKDFYNAVSQMKETLSVVNIFIRFRKSFRLPKGYGVFFMPYDVSSEFDLLERGEFPAKSMFIMHIPSNMEYDVKDCHRATLQFYHPRGNVNPDLVEKQAHLVLNQGLNDLFPGLAGAVTNYTIYNPKMYEKEFGLPAYVFGVEPQIQSPRVPVETDIHGLFLVGDSVSPEGPCVPQAMESGIQCGRLIAKQNKL
ncbi:MAG: FAD-dependent oxidoreductase [Candidatus Omnitrophota bacterium]